MAWPIQTSLIWVLLSAREYPKMWGPRVRRHTDSFEKCFTILATWVMISSFSWYLISFGLTELRTLYNIIVVPGVILLLQLKILGGGDITVGFDHYVMIEGQLEEIVGI